MLRAARRALLALLLLSLARAVIALDSASQAEPAIEQGHNAAPSAASFSVPPALSELQAPAKLHRTAYQVAIIIDDLGNHKINSLRSANLPGAMTLSILPFTPYASVIAEQGLALGKEIMLHMPMQPLEHRRAAFADGLLLSMNEQQLRAKLSAMLDSLPGVRGANNHMGSALTQNRSAMAWVMAELQARHLYFIDSRTTDKTQALEQARTYKLLSGRRDVFLDNSLEPAAIARQFETLIRLAKTRGHAIAIAHPHPATLTFLSTIHERLAQEEIQLVPVSQLLKKVGAPLVGNLIRR